MKKVKFIFFYVLVSSVCLAQETECSSYSAPEDTIHMPHFGYNEVLDSVLMVTYPEREQIITNGRTIINYENNGIPFNIPIKVWLYHDDAGIGHNDALPMAEVESLIRRVNEHFADNMTGIQFYLKCAIEHINSTRLNTIDNDNEYDDVVGNNREQIALNWHLVHTFVGSGGRARFPWKSNNLSFAADYGGALSEGEVLTTVHEIGHTLGLLHTHENTRGTGNFNGDADKCFQESVDRDKRQWGCALSVGKKCDKNGDALCDTQAAPNTESNPTIDLDNVTNCGYIGGGSDKWGDAWLDGPPPTQNYMSYLSIRRCRSRFTQGQIGVMHSYISLLFQRSGVRWHNLNAFSLSNTVTDGEVFDFYSPSTIHTPNEGESYILYAGSQVVLQAQESITLLPGFHAHNGSQVHIIAEEFTNCDQAFLDWESAYNGRVVSGYHDEITQRVDKAVEILNRAFLRGNPTNESKTMSHDRNTVSVFPNPTDGETVFLSLTNNNEVGVLKIMNSTGTTLIKTNINDGNNKVSIDLSSYPSGLYIYELQTHRGTYRGRLIKR